MRVSSSSVYDPSAVFRTEWNPQPGSFTCLLWNDLSVARVHRSIPRINVGESHLSFLIFLSDLFHFTILALIIVVYFVQLVGR